MKKTRNKYVFIFIYFTEKIQNKNLISDVKRLSLYLNLNRFEIFYSLNEL